jgi:hypothetical protein
MINDKPHRGYISTVLGCYCPRCRKGKLFKNPVSVNLKKNMQMHANCPVCEQATDIEVGFYYGTGYVSYVIALLISGLSFGLWWIIIGFSFEDNRFVYWITFNSISLLFMQPWLMRFSRSLWISWFVCYDEDWQSNKPADPERVVKGQMNNW